MRLAGWHMSRTRAFKVLDGQAWSKGLARRGSRWSEGALDEAPAAYKDPRTVMGSQADLVEAVGEFSPGIVRMDAGNRKDRRRRRAKNPRPREGR